MYWHMKKIWCRCHSDETEANNLSHEVKKKTSLSGFLLRMILTSSLFLSISASCLIFGVFPVKGAYATSTSRSSSSLPFPSSLHGTTINKHQVRNVHQYACLDYRQQINDHRSGYVCVFVCESIYILLSMNGSSLDMMVVLYKAFFVSMVYCRKCNVKESWTQCLSNFGFR